jgi:hypothetical protein
LIFFPAALRENSIRCSIEQNAFRLPITADSASTFFRQSEQRLVRIF